jgi:hypothetical protein
MGMTQNAVVRTNVHKKCIIISLHISQLNKKIIYLRVMVFNATFNNISVISWWSVLLMEEYGEKH